MQAKPYKTLGWKPKYTIADLVKEMVASDMKLFSRDKYLLEGGHEIMRISRISHQFTMEKNAKIFVAGHRGMVGSALDKKTGAIRLPEYYYTHFFRSAGDNIPVA